MNGKLRQWAAALTCCMGSFLVGAAYTWVTPLMSTLVEPESPFPALTSTDTSWLAASIEISVIICTVPIGKLSNIWGRKYLLVSVGPLCFFSYLIILTTRSIAALYAARIVQGLALGLLFVVGPMYLAEISESADRGKLGGIFQPAYYAGCAYSASLGPFVSYDNYAIAELIPCVVFSLAMTAVPESPHFSVMRGERRKGLKALAWLRDKDVEDVREEFEMVVESVLENIKPAGSIKDLFKTSNDRMGFLLVQAVCIVKYMSGSTAIDVYVTQTFSEATDGDLASRLFTIFFMLLLAFASFASSLVSDSVGRRPLLLLSSAGSGACSVIVGILFFIKIETSADVPLFIWLVFVGMIGIALTSNVGLGPLAQTIQAEYFPLSTRAIGGSVTQVVAGLSSFINVKQYQIANDLAGVYLNYWIFAFFSFSGFVLFYFLIPETKGQPLEMVQKSFAQTP